MADPPSATTVQPDPDDPKGRKVKIVSPTLQLRKLVGGRALPPIPDLKVTQVIRGQPDGRAKRVIIARKTRRTP